MPDFTSISRRPAASIRAPNRKFFQSMILLILLPAAACTERLPVPVECTRDVDCAEEKLCVSGRCRQADELCGDDQACGYGLICVSGSCSSAFCLSDCDCVFDSICETGRCVTSGRQCAVDEECDEEKLCEASLPKKCSRMRCIPPLCTSAADCNQGHFCLRGRCGIPECYWSLDCRDPDAVCRSYLCLPVECTEHYQCFHGELCLEGACRRLSCSDGGCPPASFCTTDGFCGYWPCKDAVDCFENTLCVGTACENPWCRVDGDCLPIEKCAAGMCRSAF